MNVNPVHYLTAVLVAFFFHFLLVMAIVLFGIDIAEHKYLMMAAFFLPYPAIVIACIIHVEISSRR